MNATVSSSRHRPPRRALQALSADMPFLQALRQGRFQGRGHSIFERVVNVEDERGELVTLAGRDVGNAPNTLLVDALIFGTTGFAAGDPVTASDDTLAIGDRVMIGFGAAVPWSPTMPAYPPEPSKLRANLALIRASMVQLGNQCNGSSFLGTSTEFQAETSRILGRRASDLRAALSRCDPGAAIAHGKAMIGLGPGLTPSGDDFLVGLFAVLHIEQSPCHPFAFVCADIIAQVNSRTNAISAAALKAAARGRVRESICALIGELMLGSQKSGLAFLPAVLSIGATSGADIVEGIISGFEVNLTLHRQ